MKRSSFTRLNVIFLLLSVTWAPGALAKWKYFRSGAPEDKVVTPRGGFALMGGGPKQDAAFKFLCDRANGGDFLILRANTEDEYAQQVNKEVQGICPLNSVATIVFTEREDPEDPKIVDIIDHAESIFIAGGDQANYVRFWQDTNIQYALNRHIAANKPIGGSSAGLAILGEFSFASIIDTIYSPEALADPYGNKITISRDFLRIPLLAGTITDTHFSKRDRMGRLLVFMARILQDDWASRIRAIAVDENAAVLVELNGVGTVVGADSAYFLEANSKPEICRRKTPLRFSTISVHRARSGETINVKSWKSEQGEDYVLSVDGGKVKSTSKNGIY
jgi:cyanophycinase